MSRLTRDGTAEPVSRDQILRHVRGQGNIHFSCSADHVQDWQPYPVDFNSSYMCDHKAGLATMYVCIVCMVITYNKSKDEPGKVVNLARGQLNRENGYFSVPVRAWEFGRARRVRQSRPASACSSPCSG